MISLGGLDSVPTTARTENSRRLTWLYGAGGIAAVGGLLSPFRGGRECVVHWCDPVGRSRNKSTRKSEYSGLWPVGILVDGCLIDGRRPLDRRLPSFALSRGPESTCVAGVPSAFLVARRFLLLGVSCCSAILIVPPLRATQTGKPRMMEKTGLARLSFIGSRVPGRGHTHGVPLCSDHGPGPALPRHLCQLPGFGTNGRAWARFL